MFTYAGYGRANFVHPFLKPDMFPVGEEDVPVLHLPFQIYLGRCGLPLIGVLDFAHIPHRSLRCVQIF